MGALGCQDNKGLLTPFFFPFKKYAKYLALRLIVVIPIPGEITSAKLKSEVAWAGRITIRFSASLSKLRLQILNPQN